MDFGYSAIFVPTTLSRLHHTVYKVSFSRKTCFSNLQTCQTPLSFSKTRNLLLGSMLFFMQRYIFNGRIAGVKPFEASSTWAHFPFFEKDAPVWEVCRFEKRVLREKLTLYTVWWGRESVIGTNIAPYPKSIKIGRPTTENSTFLKNRTPRGSS